MKLTTEQIQEILSGAEKFGSSVDHYDFYIGQCLPNGTEVRLSDLREILELRQEVERLNATIAEMSELCLTNKEVWEIQAETVEESLDWLESNYPNACHPACGLLQHYANQLREQGDE